MNEVTIDSTDAEIGAKVRGMCQYLSAKFDAVGMMDAAARVLVSSHCDMNAGETKITYHDMTHKGEPWGDVEVIVRKARRKK